jgi:hypothetical protein
MMRDPLNILCLIGLLLVGVIVIGAVGAIAEIRAVDELEVLKLPAQVRP